MLQTPTSANSQVSVGKVHFGNDLPLALIAGPCALESRAHALEMVAALKEIERLAPGHGYVQVDAYHTEAERETFLGWVLTAVTFLKPEEWRELFAEAGYKGDYYWTILEANPEWNDFNACDPASANPLIR